MPELDLTAVDAAIKHSPFDGSFKWEGAMFKAVH